MAQRYGGEHSPKGGSGGEGRPAAGSRAQSHPYNDKTRTKAGLRVNALFIAPLPLVIFAFFQSPEGMALDLVAFGVLIAAAWMTREGVLAQEAYDARKIAKRPAMPRKIFGSVMTGLGLFIAGFTTLGAIFTPVIFAVLGAGLHFFAFGPDPMTDKGAEGIDQFQSDRVARAVDEAEKHLRAMSDAILRAKEREVTQRVERFQGTVRAMFRTVEEDPRDLTASKKYLSVYLMGARDASVSIWTAAFMVLRVVTFSARRVSSAAAYSGESTSVDRSASTAATTPPQSSSTSASLASIAGSSLAGSTTSFCIPRSE